MTLQTQSAAKRMLEIASLSKVMPVVVIDKLEHAIPLAESLLSGGIQVMEITLRTPAALPAIKVLKQQFGSKLHLGAGTITNLETLEAARAAGADFGVSPATSLKLKNNLITHSDFPFMAGATSLSEAMNLWEDGAGLIKFFPAVAAGGVQLLKAWQGPMPYLKICPTGGIDQDNYQAFLKLESVICVGMSWLCQAQLMENQDWQEITRRTKFVTQKA